MILLNCLQVSIFIINLTDSAVIKINGKELFLIEGSTNNKHLVNDSMLIHRKDKESLSF
jgi:hypothetical protein